MTDEERSEEGAEEAIEDLDAPAAAQEDVAGGAIACRPPTQIICRKPSEIDQCSAPTCKTTEVVAQAF